MTFELLFTAILTVLNIHWKNELGFQWDKV